MKETTKKVFYSIDEEKLSKINGGKRKKTIFEQTIDKIIFSNRSILPFQ